MGKATEVLQGKKHEMFTTENLVEYLVKEIIILSSAYDLQKENVANEKRPLFEKIQYDLKQTKKRYSFACFPRFNYRCSYDISNLTGNKLLQFLVKILNDDWNDGDAVILFIDRKYHAAVLKYSTTKLEFKTHPFPREQLDNRFIFPKLFDDSHVQSVQMGKKYLKIYYAPVKIKLLREDARHRFVVFLEKKMSENITISHPYHYAFMGLLYEIAKTKICTLKYMEAKGILNDIPVAAYVKLAMDTQQIGKLKRVFGEREILIGKKGYVPLS
ncbi:uncharacterized protein LOC143465466 [Clavelina lepadiformis]|uniref:uncharacterized protein LOC143465466 n=1 Tax=Clavelina lepadiformis TaxID=159417 RepID=UPI0040420A36